MICVGSLDQKMRKPVIPASSQPLYADGKILFVRDQLLMAQRFDLDKLQTVGDPFAAGEQGIERDVFFSHSIGYLVRFILAAVAYVAIGR